MADITFRLDKGSELTHQELDENFGALLNSASFNATSNELTLYYTGSANVGSETDLVINLASNVGVVETISGMIESGSNKSYILDQSAAYTYDIEEITIQSSTGTATATLEIDGTPVSGISVSVSTSEVTDTATGANSVAVGGKVDLVLASDTGTENVGFTIKTTRT